MELMKREIFADIGERITIFVLSHAIYVSRNVYRNDQVKRHQTIHTLDKKYQCKYCWPTSFSRIGDLTRHVNKLHRGIAGYICKYEKCNEMFPSLTALEFHEHDKHNKKDKIIKKSKKEYKCDHCPYSATRKCSLTDRMLILILEFGYSLVKRVSRGFLQRMEWKNISQYIH